MDAETLETSEAQPSASCALWHGLLTVPPASTEGLLEVRETGGPPEWHGQETVPQQSQETSPQQRGSLTAERFARGDYATVALKGGEHEWQTYAALGLIGKTREAVEGLSRFDRPEAAFYTAVAHWIGGEDDAAMRLLETVPTAHARNLLALLRKPRIDVLTQWSWHRGGCADLLSGAAADPRFRVANISFHPDDLPNKAYANIHDYCASFGSPDFYVCAMVEWHLLPPNLQELSCPLFGHTADYDLHIQTVCPWLELFDAVLVTDPSEWLDVSRLVRVPVHTFPKSFGVPHYVPPLGREAREIDVYLSGTLLHPYHPDKALLFHQLLEDPSLRLKAINGFTESPDYYADLARSKICITYVRHATALPTRGLEGLAMGCALIVQEDNVLTLFAGPEQGVLTYQLENRDVSATVRSILARWPDIARRAEAGSRFIRREFALTRVASQYLRFLTFLAAQPRGPRSLCDPKQFYQKRSVLCKGWLPSYDFPHSPVLKSIAIHNYRRIQSALTTEPDSPHLYIDLARESVLAQIHRAEADLIPTPKWLAFVHDVYRTARQRFPRSLVTRFNNIRVILHFGDPELVSEALELLDETLASPPNHWQIDVMEDVFPWDFFPQFFNYRSYFDRITQHLTRGGIVEPELSRLILASLHAYRGFYPTYHGFYSQALDDYGRAAALDPDFPFFGLWHAEQLLQRGLPDDRSEASRLLCELAKGSLVFREALEMLVQSGEAAEDIVPRASQGRDFLQINESMGAPKLQLRPALSEIERERDKAWHEWQAWKAEREQLYKIIQSMESSKFWKLRQQWIKLKRRIWK